MTSDELERISNLPEKLSSDELEKEFSLIFEAGGNAEIEGERNLIMAALSELSDRQWNKYKLLREDLRAKLSTFVLDIWDRNSLEATENLISIIIKIGLPDTLAYLVSIDAGSLKPEILSEIVGADVEIGDTAGDPYSGMRK